MPAKQHGKIVTAIDIGTTKICTIIAHVQSEHDMTILGIGSQPSDGLKNGIVVDIRMAAYSIRKSLLQAEEKAGIKVGDATVGISGAHIQSFNSRAAVPIKYQDVDENDIERVIEAAKDIPIPDGREILHVIPQYFRIDGQELVQESIGMHGNRLEAQVHIVTGAVWSAQNIIRACELAGISARDIVLEPIASAEAVLTASERELGTAILDIGGGTSDFAIYKHGRIIHSKVIPIAGTHFTRDLALCLELPLPIAEMVKCSEGAVVSSELTAGSAKITTPESAHHAPKEIEKKRILEVLNPRALEVLEFIQDEVIKFHLGPLMRSGLVITGGGSLLKGMDKLAAHVLNMPVRLGVPTNESPEHELQIPQQLASPIFATAYGILLFAAKGGRSELSDKATKTLFIRVFKRMKNWIYDFI